MAPKTAKLVSDFGETTVTSKGQITLPSAMRQALDLVAGDHVRFAKDVDGRLIVTARKRRSILDIAEANSFSVGKRGRDLDAAIDDAVGEALEEQDTRARFKDRA